VLAKAREWYKKNCARILKKQSEDQKRKERIRQYHKIGKYKEYRRRFLERHPDYYKQYKRKKNRL